MEKQEISKKLAVLVHENLGISIDTLQPSVRKGLEFLIKSDLLEDEGLFFDITDPKRDGGKCGCVLYLEGKSNCDHYVVYHTDKRIAKLHRVKKGKEENFTRAIASLDIDQLTSEKKTDIADAIVYLHSLRYHFDPSKFFQSKENDEVQLYIKIIREIFYTNSFDTYGSKLSFEDGNERLVSIIRKSCSLAYQRFNGTELYVEISDLGKRVFPTTQEDLESYADAIEQRIELCGACNLFIGQYLSNDCEEKEQILLVQGFSKNSL